MPTKPTEGSFVAIMRRGEDGEPQILTADRADGKGLNLIGGRMEADETPRGCAVRETFEETGFAVELRGLIGDDLLKENDDGEVTDIARIYRAEYLGGSLRDSNESNGFRWVSMGDLPNLKVARVPCPGYPEGRTYAMIERALRDSRAIFSVVSDPDGLAA